jgi:hypothetical protein
MRLCLARIFPLLFCKFMLVHGEFGAFTSLDLLCVSKEEVELQASHEPYSLFFSRYLRGRNELLSKEKYKQKSIRFGKRNALRLWKASLYCTEKNLPLPKLCLGLLFVFFFHCVLYFELHRLTSHYSLVESELNKLYSLMY